MNRRSLATLLVLAGGLAFPACSGDSKPADPPACPGVTEATCPDSVPSYASDIAPIIDAQCNHCHSPGNADGLWPLTDQESVNEWTDTILRQIRACAQPPVDSGYALTLEDRQTLEAWLVCGAPNN